MSLRTIFSKGSLAQAPGIFSKGLTSAGRFLTKGSQVASNVLNFANNSGITAALSTLPDVGPAIAQGAAQAPQYINTASAVGNALTNAGNAIH